MMNKKMLVAGLVGVTLSAAASTSMAAPAAGLTLSSSGAPTDIAVYCNNKKGIYEIPANGSLKPLPWGAIILMFGSTDLQCTFKLDNGQVVGTAHLSMTLSTGTVSNASTSAGYSVNINPGQNQAYPGISVNLQKS